MELGNRFHTIKYGTLPGYASPLCYRMATMTVRGQLAMISCADAHPLHAVSNGTGSRN
ncbi:hypothetical protein BJ997_003227 [Cryobacterium roopkundense]|uniref:Uncharacterized protein n=1 Tax=Cryobacterium roopkundense TaxID=1001240 RepID=A0A7W8ZYP4_9MICO|nr:hypothetical protein [Cryobacterium roopkundense]